MHLRTQIWALCYHGSSPNDPAFVPGFKESTDVPENMSPNLDKFNYGIVFVTATLFVVMDLGIEISA